MSTKIEWTDKTWNPLTGCTIVSPGCHNCYAMRLSARLEAMGQEKYAGVTKDGRWTGKIKLIEKALAIPFKWRKPRMVFVNSMSDLFHEDVPFEFIDKVFAVMHQCHQHTFQILTKRISNAVDFADRRPLYRHPLPNVLIGPSIENQRTCNERLPDAVRLAQMGWQVMLSLEPMLGPISLSEAVDDWWESANVPAWVIVGGESGPGARPMHPDWPRSIRDQCVAHGVPFFFKQWGEWSPRDSYDRALDVDPVTGVAARRGIDTIHAPGIRGPNSMFRAGKKKAGRLLDGCEWNEMPVAPVQIST